MRASLLAVTAVGLACAAACDSGGREAPDEPATTAAFLTLQGFVAVEDGALSGYLGWDYVADDPEEYADPRSVCRTWEELAGDRDQSLLATECPSCREGYGVAAALASTTCAGDLAEHPESRAWRVGLAPVDPEDGGLGEALAEAGFTHVVWSDWAPEGELEAMDAVFGAYPVAWSGPDGVPGTDDGVALSGEFELYALYYWELGS